MIARFPVALSTSAFAPLFLRARADQTSFYFRQLHALLRAGIGLSLALSTLSEQKASPALRRASAEMSRRVSAGQPWHQAMRNYPGLFSEMTISMVEAAEAGGFLERACLILADNAEREYQIYQIIKRDAWYPKLLLFFSTVVVPLPLPLGFYLLGATEQIFIIVGVWGVWRAANFLWPVGARGGAVRLWIDGVRLKTPLAGKTIRALAVAKFCRFLGMSYAAGISLPRGVTLAASACGNGVIAQKIAAIIPMLERGCSLTEALVTTGEIPTTTVPLLQSGEISGDLDAQLQAAARFLETEAETALRQTVIALAMAIFLLVAAKIGAQVIQFHRS